jgi:hypothetical protein
MAVSFPLPQASLPQSNIVTQLLPGVPFGAARPLTLPEPAIVPPVITGGRAVSVGVEVRVLVAVGVGVSVGDGVLVGVVVWVGVIVRVALGVAVPDAVAVGV